MFGQRVLKESTNSSSRSLVTPKLQTDLQTLAVDQRLVTYCFDSPFFFQPSILTDKVMSTFSSAFKSS